MATATPERPQVFNLPNQLTAARFVLGIVLFALIEVEQWIACIIVFALAAVTDWLDGYLARRQGLVSTLGRNLDPLVDKVLICGAYTFLIPYGYADGWMVPWMVTVVVARELIITSLRTFLEGRGANFGADWLGKLKMGLQCAVIIGVLLIQWWRAAGFSPAVLDVLDPVQRVLLWAMLVATVGSGVQYLVKAARLLR